MKKILAFFLSTAMSFSLFALDIFNYVPLSGNVKSYTQTDFDIASKFGNYFRTASSKYVNNLNNSGKVVELIELSARDAVLNKTTNKYDVYGNLTEQSCFDADSNLLWKTVITYTNGQKTDSSEYAKDGVLKAKTIFTYENGKLADETGYDGEGALLWKIVYKYNAAGKEENIFEYSADGSLDIQETYTYTDAGLIDSITTYDAYTETSEQKVFRYAANNSLSEITTYNQDKEVTNRVVLKYDNNGNVSKISEYNIAQKFGTTVNELISMSEYTYQ